MGMSPVDHTKARIGYVAATQRDRCGNCSQSTEQDRFWTCKKHGLMVTVYAYCDEWTVRIPHGYKVPPSGAAPWVDLETGEQRVTPRPAPHKRPPGFSPG